MGITHAIRTRLALDCDEVVARFLARGEVESDTLTGAQLDNDARRIAASLAALGLARSPIVLVFEPGLDFTRALIGCLYAGALAIPAPEPRAGASIERLERILAASAASHVLTSRKMSETIAAKALPTMRCAAASRLAIEDLLVHSPAEDCAGWDADPERPCVVQFTSGTTSAPRGVLLSARSLLANVGQATRGMSVAQRGVRETVVNWMPFYHDLGMIGGVLIPLAVGLDVVHLPPLAFVQRPERWLRAISRYRARVSGAPGFAFDLCRERISDETIAELDLSCWEVAFAGAEPISAATLDGFAKRFAPAGFSRNSLFTTFGLAETCLYAGGSHDPGAPAGAPGRAVCRLNAESSDAIRVVDQGHIQGEGRIGEIWISSPSVASGYMSDPEGTARVFGARLVPDDGRVYMRTGDLGYLSGNALYVSGRIKDVIIRNGVSIAAVEIEECATRHQSALLDPAAAVAIQRDDIDGPVMLIVERRRKPLDSEQEEAAKRSMRGAVGEELALKLDMIEIVPPGSLPRTTSGKLQRALVRQQYFATMQSAA